MSTFSNLSKCFLFACVLMHTVFANNKMVIYWGQGTIGNIEKPLAHYCSSGNFDIIVIGFAYLFPNVPTTSPDYPVLNFAGHCETNFNNDPSLPLNCSASIGNDITFCQSLGVQILLSFGGGVGTYGFSASTPDSQASTFATQVWNMFMEGTASKYRPFGDAIIDGVDLDIEGGPAYVGYGAFIGKLRSYFATSKRTYYISAAPQCPYPDRRLGPDIPPFITGTPLQAAWFDYIWVQFYNNPCGVNTFGTDLFNANQWAYWAANLSVNPNAKFFIGAPASPLAAAAISFVGASQLQAIHNSMVQKYPNQYGGLMFWDCANSDYNTDPVTGLTFGAQAAAFVHSSSNSQANPIPTATPTVTPSPPIALQPLTTGAAKPSTTGARTIPSSTTGAKATIRSTTGARTMVSSTTSPRTSRPSTTGVKAVPSSSTTGAKVSLPSTSTTGANAASSNPSPIGPVSGSCPTDGYMVCASSETYQTCSHGQWAAEQSCQTGLTCSPSGNYIYCV